MMKHRADESQYLFKPNQTPNVTFQILLRNSQAYIAAFEIINYDISAGKYAGMELASQTKFVLAAAYKFLAKLSFHQPKT